MTKIKRQERNSAVLGQLVMWAKYLQSQDKSTLFDEGYTYLSFGELLSYPVDFWINDKQWLDTGKEDEDIYLLDSEEGLFS